MGRELKRVPLDFNAPLDKTWEGYINPYGKEATKCFICDGSGSSPEALILQEKWYGHRPFKPEDNGSVPFDENTPEVVALATRNCERWPGGLKSEIQRLLRHFNGQWSHHLNEQDVAALLKADRLWDFTRVPRTEEQKEIVRQRMAAGEDSWLPEDNGYIPTPEEVNRWSLQGIGHDSCNCWVVTKAELERRGLPSACAYCDGEGSTWSSPEAKEAYEDWEPREPPAGEGYQLWENTSEGSPQSPVFKTLEDLAAWCEDNATTFGSSKATKEEWIQMLGDDFVCHKEGNLVFI